MKISHKLIIGISFTLAAMMLIVVFCLNISRNMHKEFALLREDIIPGALAMSQMERRCEQTAYNLMNYIVTATKEEEVISGMELLNEAGLEHLQHESHIGSEEKKAAEKLMANIHKFNFAFIMDLQHKRLTSVYLRANLSIF